MYSSVWEPEEAGILYSVSCSLLAADDLKVFASLTELLGEGLNLAGCSIWRREQGAPGPERLGFYQHHDGVILDYLPNLDYQVAHRVTQSGEMLIENNIGQRAGFKAGPLCPGLIALPLEIDGKAAGALCLWVAQNPGAATVSLNLARETARLLACGLRRYENCRPENDDKTGAENEDSNLQNGITRPRPVIPGITFDIRTLEKNARGGDFFDTVLTKDNNLVLIMGTMMGPGNSVLPWKHGVGLVLKMLALKKVEPGRACTELNGLLYDDLHNAGMLLGLLFACYNPLTGSLTFCNAGYNPPVIVGNNNDHAFSGGTSETFIGYTKSILYSEKTLRLKNGDAVVFYSNGAAELINGEGMHYPRERLEQTVRKYHYFNAHSLLDCLVLDIHQFLGGRRLLEQVTLAVMKVE